MSDSESKKCFYSRDGIRPEGPVNFSELKQLHAKGELENGAICSVQNANETYELWRPVSRYNLKRQEFDSRSHQVERLADILRIYSGWFIGLNLTNPKTFDVVHLMRVERDFFGVCPRGSDDSFYYPCTQVLSVAESMKQIECQIQRPVDLTIKQGTLSKFFQGDIERLPTDWVKAKIEVPLLVEVNHLIAYKGPIGVGVGVGVSTPIN